MRVVIVNEFPVFSEALGIAISNEPDLEFVGSARTADEAVNVVREHSPDVAVIDLDLSTASGPRLDGIDLAKLIKTARPEIRVLILSAQMELGILARAAGEGACGFLSKSSALTDVCRAIRTAKDGGMYVEDELITPLLEKIRATTVPAISGGSTRVVLTLREAEVLNLLGEGKDVGSIAKRLGITLNTSRGHVKNILMKLGCHSQLEAVLEAMRLGLLPAVSR